MFFKEPSTDNKHSWDREHKVNMDSHFYFKEYTSVTNSLTVSKVLRTSSEHFGVNRGFVQIKCMCMYCLLEYTHLQSALPQSLWEARVSV